MNPTGVPVQLFLVLTYVILSSKATLIGTKQRFFEALEKCGLMCELALNKNSGTELVINTIWPFRSQHQLILFSVYLTLLQVKN